MAGGRASTRRQTVLLGLTLWILIGITYHSTFTAGTIIDDENYVTANETLRTADGLREIWLDAHASPQYYPLVFTSFWLEYRLWGDLPSGYHVVNVLLHALCALILWRLLVVLRIPYPWLVSALFALHPVQVESVAWISERKNTLSTLFFLLSAWVFLRNRFGRFADVARNQGLVLLASLFLFAAALLSKTSTMTLPAVLLIILWWRDGSVRRGDIFALLPFFALGFGTGLITLSIETGKIDPTVASLGFSPLERILVAGRAFWFYLGKLILPVRLCFQYELWVIRPSSWWAYLYPVGAIGLILALWIARRRLGRGPFVAILIFAGVLAPTLGFLDLYFFRYSFVADHFQYLPSVALFVLMAAAARKLDLDRPLRRRISIALASALLILMSGMSMRHARAFGSLEELCHDILSKNPESWLANNSLGNLRMQDGEIEEAILHFERALEISDAYIETHLNLSIAMMNTGRYEEARMYVRHALAIDPESKFGDLRMGEIELRAGRPREAIRWFQDALSIDPTDLGARSGLGIALTQARREDEAIPILESLVGDDPQRPIAWMTLGLARAQLGLYPEATEALEEALRLDPQNGAIRTNLERVREIEKESTKPR